MRGHATTWERSGWGIRLRHLSSAVYAKCRVDYIALAIAHHGILRTRSIIFRARPAHHNGDHFVGIETPAESGPNIVEGDPCDMIGKRLQVI